MVLDHRHADRKNGSLVSTLRRSDNVLRVCRERNDEWAVAVHGRLSAGCDIIAEEARYHHQCMQYFFNKRPQVSDAPMSRDPHGRQ